MYLILLFDYFELKISILNQMLIAVVLTFGIQSNDYIESYLICIDHDIFIHCLRGLTYQMNDNHLLIKK